LQSGVAYAVLINIPVYAGLALIYALLFQRRVVREMFAVLLNRGGKPATEQA
jgi:hypothetical protein